ncbi:MAG: toll/interleukin-1 receptor domain-containing protein, partial [Ktedonobacterales bacterium]
MAAPVPTAPRIFISYNRQDSAFTHRLVDYLERASVSVWVDWEGARDGDFLKRINQGLRLCDWLVLVETPHSLQSDPVEMEVHAALNRVLYGQMRGVVRLVAATRDTRSVPPTWATLQYYDATSDFDSAVAAMLAAIRAGDAREARRPGAEHPGASVISPVTAPVASATLTDGQRLFNRMVSATAEADWQSAVDVADLLLAEYPDALKAQPPDALTTNFYRLRGRALLELGRPGDAATALQTAYACDRMDIPTMRAAARACLQAHNAAGAEPLLKRAVTLEEDDESRLDILREYVPTLVALDTPEKLDEALIRIDQALRLRRDDPAWLTQRRDLLMRRGRNAEALEEARPLATRPDADAADWLALARLARLTGARDEAVTALLRAQALDLLDASAPGLTEERSALLTTLATRREQAAKANQWAVALQLLDDELTLAPDDRSRQIAYADLLRRVGRDGEARDTVGALAGGRYGAVTAADEALSVASLCA